MKKIRKSQFFIFRFFFNFFSFSIFSIFSKNALSQSTLKPLRSDFQFRIINIFLKSKWFNGDSPSRSLEQNQ